MNEHDLCAAALAARKQAYAPYSGYAVGAALLTADGTVYTGCNVENASYGATLCAERTAFATAISNGHREFVMLAVAGGHGDALLASFTPCGICRQVMAEFCSPSFRVLVAKNAEQYTAYSLGDLLPAAFACGNSHSGFSQNQAFRPSRKA